MPEFQTPFNDTEEGSQFINFSLQIQKLLFDFDLKLFLFFYYAFLKAFTGLLNYQPS